MDCRAPGSSVLHYLLEFAQIHVHWFSDALYPCHPLLPSSPSAFSLGRWKQLKEVCPHRGVRTRSFKWQEEWRVCTKLLQLCLTLCDPMDSSPPLSPWDSPGKNTGVGCHALLQASSRESSLPGDQTCTPKVSFIDRWVIYHQHHLGSPSKG